MKKRIYFAIISLIYVIVLSACDGGQKISTNPEITYQYTIDLDLQTGISDKLENGYYKLPAITVHTIADGVKTDSISYTGNITLENEHMEYSYGFLYIRDSSESDFSTIIVLNLTRISLDKESDNVELSFPFKKLHIPMTSIAIVQDSPLYFSAKGVTGDGRTSLSVKTVPSSASYKESIFFIEYVILNSVKITENLDNYALITEKGLLSLVDKILKVGDIVGVKAKSVKDNVVSEIFEVPVCKLAVVSVRLTVLNGNSESSYYDYNYTNQKDNLLAHFEVTPHNATFADQYTVTIVNPEECPFVSFKLEQYRMWVVIDENSFIKNRTLEFYVTVDGVESNHYQVLMR